MQTDSIQRIKNGSIDYHYYAARGQLARSKQLYHSFARLNRIARLSRSHHAAKLLVLCLVLLPVIAAGLA